MLIDEDNEPFINVKMNPEIKAQWIANLLSGEYAQAKASLRKIFITKRSNGKKEGFCCLGVLCDMYTKATGDGNWVRVDNFGKLDPNGARWQFRCVAKPRYPSVLRPEDLVMRTFDGLLPDKVLEWAGIENNTAHVKIGLDGKDANKLRRDVPNFEFYSSQRNIITLVQLNDSGRTFPTIAKTIDKYL